MNSINPINLGYACINTELRKKGIFMSRTCRIKTIEEKGIEYVKLLAIQNLTDLKTMLEWNHQNNILVFRLSSDIFPFASHKIYGYTLEFAKDLLKECGDLATTYGIRLTLHPGQYNVLNSDKENVVENTIRDLSCQCEVLDKMGLGSNSVMVIHGGSGAGGKLAALQRFEENYKLLPKNVQDRIVLENCEMCYTIEDLLPLCEKINTPLVFDYHHHNLNPGKEDLYTELIPKILQTWNRRSIKPKFHLSESRDPMATSISKRRAHSELITGSKSILEKHPQGVDLMLECKLKEQAVQLLRSDFQKCMNLFSQL